MTNLASPLDDLDDVMLKTSTEIFASTEISSVRNQKFPAKNAQLKLSS